MKPIPVHFGLLLIWLLFSISATAQTTITSQISNDDDDAEERVSNGEVDVNSSDLELIRDGNDQLVGVRFRNINVPQGETILSASIQFTVDETDTGSTSLLIHGEDRNNAKKFKDDDDNISDRRLTTASVAWNSIPAWNSVGQAGVDQRTPDLKNIVQEIVNRGGWSSGNNMVFIFSGSGQRTAEAHDGDSSKAPILTITYGTPPAGTDTDGDGIDDDVDIDDDNDGITDVDEYCTTTSAAFLVSMDTGTRSVVVNHNNTGYAKLDFSSMDNSFQLDINGTTVHPSGMEFENGALDPGEEYFVFQSDNAFITSPWVANNNGLPRLRLIIDELGNVTLQGTRSTTSTALEPMKAQAGTSFNSINWVSGANNVFTITNQAGPGPEGFTGEFFASVICDSDGDGKINSLDLDGDNDGIYDAVEVGHGRPHTNGVISGPFGTNGLVNALETTADSGIINYVLADTDGTGLPNFLDLDSDDDGCNDANEAYQDANADGGDNGFYGTGNPPATDALGRVNAATYQVPADGNSNGTMDYIEAIAPPTITVQPMDTVTCPGCNATISTTASSADTYQWQYFNGSIWVNLSDSGIYSGTATSTLTLTNVTPAYNAVQYKVVLSNTGQVCDMEISNNVSLAIRVSTVITNKRITYRVNKN
ncbi:immunoglobulin domain-containing protein [Flavobacteriaceae bacterium F89]|uniref:Immunoglobulin domain-containing protein n=1 Tax=Cerina litoralis TaxID=2874477 RepID=A0AAE3F020_9FLAO|nr:immunoglobulin domain-containing protein [Cerina litoralis]MCG2462926.1 immunoglobulin domain-containing protein [Cerina litoralis]